MGAIFLHFWAVLSDLITNLTDPNTPLSCFDKKPGFSSQFTAALFILVAILLLGSTSCTSNGDGSTRDLAAEEDFAMAVKLISGAFANGDQIPQKYTCDGEDISPSLSWSGLPASTISLALIMDDPDAPGGTWVHWVLYNLPVSGDGIIENVAQSEDVPGGGNQGTNSWNRIGYGGPCPPSGTHRYVFRLYALDITLDLQPGATKADLIPAMVGHVLDKGQLLGLYSRS